MNKEEFTKAYRLREVKPTAKKTCFNCARLSIGHECDKSFPCTHMHVDWDFQIRRGDHMVCSEWFDEEDLLW